MLFSIVKLFVTYAEIDAVDSLEQIFKDVLLQYFVVIGTINTAKPFLFYRRHFDLVLKFSVGLKALLQYGLSEPEFYGDSI